MEPLEILNILCAVAGIALFAYCIALVNKILKLFPGAKMNKSWKIVNVLIAFFLVGYGVNIVAVFAGLTEVLLVMQALVYLFGALFVVVVVRLSLRTFQILKQSAGQGSRKE